MGCPVSDKPALAAESVPKIARLFRLQYEESQQRWVLLYPEGMVQLNQSAGEILKRCDGAATIASITADLQRAFSQPDLSKDVMEFMEVAHERGWIRI